MVFLPSARSVGHDQTSLSAMTQPIDKFSWVHPWTMLIGFGLTLVLLAWAGRRLSHDGFHDHFVRFHPMIAPDSNYRPTVAEMQGVVRQNARPDQILVVVAGNSILQGVGQPAGAVWSQRLQELLGPKYAVVNLAFRGSSPTTGGTIVAEALRDEYPRQILIANMGATESIDPLGTGDYLFIVYDAYYKGLLLSWAPRDTQIKALPQLSESLLNARIDRWFYQNSFWNWWSTQVAFTFPTPMQPELSSAFDARGNLRDRENDYDDFPFKTRFAPEFEARNLEIAAARSSDFYPTQTDGQWELATEVYERFLTSAGNAIPDALKSRTLLLLGRDAPYYTHQLSPEIQARDDLAFSRSVDGLESIGYASMQYGRDYAPSQYGDRTHLTKSGGARLAADVAPKVRALAAKLGYVQP